MLTRPLIVNVNWGIFFISFSTGSSGKSSADRVLTQTDRQTQTDSADKLNIESL